MKIALCHFRVGETDGVSLEMEKWKQSLETLGHEVFFLAGSTESEKGYVIDELYYQHAQNNKFVFNAYSQLRDYCSKQEFREDILNFVSKIEEKLEKFISEYKIDVLVPNNIWSLGWGIPAAIAFANISKRCGINCIAHHHDFYWERDRYSHPTCDFIQNILDDYFPPRTANIRHVVINEIAKEQLKIRKGLDSVVVPNVFDFEGAEWKIDEFNSDFRTKIGAGENDIIVLQATRITERKAIELAIDVAGELCKPKYIAELRKNGLYDGRSFKDGKIILVFAGLPEADEKYIQKLYRRAERKGVQIFDIHHMIKAERYTENGRKYYSLWDAYVFADIITYPSILEGWGNQFLEGLFAKKPMVVYEYPVYLTDIKEKGFNIVSLGVDHSFDEEGLVKVCEDLIERAAQDCVRLLSDACYRKDYTDHNFELGRRYYSNKSLMNLLKGLFQF
jgi:mannosylglucosylglycerate synthase